MKASAALELVREGELRSVILVADPDSKFLSEAAEELQWHLRKASGATVPIQPANAGEEVPAGHVRIFIGPAPGGLSADDLLLEEYRVRAADGRIDIVGHDGDVAQQTVRGANRSKATLWGVHHLLDHHLGVRWLWPGELGTLVPAQPTIRIPSIDFSGRPAMAQRRLRIHLDRRSGEQAPQLHSAEEVDRLITEALRWQERHQMGNRSDYRFGHSFMRWWDLYSEEHPDYFAVPPPGHSQPYPRASRVKLNLGNPAVRDRVVREWREAGEPDFWNVAPNDGRGFCTGEASRAMDIPPDQDVEEIWRGSANLTARYVRFWNSLLEEMHRTNPRMELGSYAYSNYRDPPPPEVKLAPGMVLGVVHTYHAYEEWQAWADSGAHLILRPNWWHMGSEAPHIPLRKAGEFFRFAQERNMVGFDFDSLNGYWGLQGAYYYLIARLSQRPDLSIDDVIEEFASGFGGAAPAISDYLEYWERFTEEAAYPIPAGGIVSQNPDGRYETLAEEHTLSIHPLRGSWQILPYLYTDEALSPAHKHLDRAEELAADDPAEVLARIDFLRDGLRHLQQTREVVRLGYARHEDPTLEEEFNRQFERLKEMRGEMGLRHVVWAEDNFRRELHRGIPTVPRSAIREESLEGL